EFRSNASRSSTSQNFPVLVQCDDCSARTCPPTAFHCCLLKSLQQFHLPTIGETLRLSSVHVPPGDSMPTILVFSHLRWDFVYQRPQHLLSRLAEHYQIRFFEEPSFRPGQSGLECASPHPNITVCKPHT